MLPNVAATDLINQTNVKSTVLEPGDDSGARLPEL